MRKHYIFLLAMALSLAAAGVWANTPSTITELWVSSDGVHFTLVARGGNMYGFQSTTNGFPIAITDYLSRSYRLYYTNAASARLYNNSYGW